MIARFFPFMLILLVLVVGVSGIYTQNNSNIIDYNVRQAPTIFGENLESYSAPTIGSLKGQYILVNFFASWCLPCIYEMRELEKLPDNLHIYGVAWKDNKNELEKWLKEQPKAYDSVVLDNEGKTAIPYGITGVPESFLINSEGNIIFHHKGAVAEDIAKIINEYIKSSDG